jgi:hypothetical protein
MKHFVRQGDEIAVFGDAIPLLRGYLIREQSELKKHCVKCETVLGSVVDGLAQSLADVTRLLETLGAAHAHNVARVDLTVHSVPWLCHALRHALEEQQTRRRRDELRRQLDAQEGDLVAELQGTDEIVSALQRIVGEPATPIRLRSWLASASSPRLELLRETCLSFLNLGSWLSLKTKVKSWKRRDINADVYEDAQSLAPFARVDASRDELIATIEGFALFSEASPYVELLLSVLRLGAFRFYESCREHRAPPSLEEGDILALASELPRGPVMTFMNGMSEWMSGQRWAAPFVWIPDRRALRLLPAVDVDCIMARAGGFTVGHVTTPEDCLLLLQTLADTWIESGLWPSHETLLAHPRLGPEFVHALDVLLHAWIQPVENGAIRLDLDAVLLFGSNTTSLTNNIARLIGTLADKLEIGIFARSGDGILGVIAAAA